MQHRYNITVFYEIEICFMIKNFFRIALRNIVNNKGFTFINVTGMAVGLAASLLILLWVRNELSYEDFNVNAKNIFRVEEDQFYSGERYHVTVTPHPSGPEWREKIPEITDQTRLNRLPRLLFRKDDKVFFESSVYAVDSGLFSIFTFPLVLGDARTALRGPHSILLTEKLARKYFGDKNPLGETLMIENTDQFMVTGVIKDLPRNTLFGFDAVIPYSFMREMGQNITQWGNNSILTFVLLANGSDVSAVNKKLTDVVLEHMPETITKYLLFPLTDIHLRSQFGFRESKAAVITIYIFTLIAIFILLIACINFLNLATAKAATRAREIAIKKVAGADQKTLVFQFMMESILLVLAALIIALLLIVLSINIFNNVSGKNFTVNDVFTPGFILSFLIVGLMAGIISGIYPAFYLASLKPSVILKGENVAGKGHGRLRHILVIVQFTLSILIAVAAINLFLQLRFLQQKDLGYAKENLICIPMADNMKPKYYPLKKVLTGESLIQGVTASTVNPVRIGSNSGGADWEGRDPEKRVLIGVNAIDYDYLSTMKMKLLSGRDFSRDYPGDIARDTLGNFLVNEEVAKLMGTDDPVGKKFRFMGLNGTIVGLLKNFHFKGADQEIEPMAFALADTSYLNVILIRLTPGNIKASLNVVEKRWKELLPEYPLQYTFVDQDYENIFRSQIRLADLLKYFTILAVIIASLGLYGLSSFSAERRTNEVGIRKVMGADPLVIMFTLAKEFLVPVVISIVIALPLGWIIVGKLLKQFAYRIELSVPVFIAVAISAIIIAMLTVSFQAYKASCANPAESLKVE
jgi:putative ABC transport system permease protein